MVKAIINDLSGGYLKTLSGSYKNGAFYYKPSAFAEEEHFDYDPSAAIKIPNWLGALESIAVFEFDGKNYRQKTLKDKVGEYNIVDYIQTYKITQLRKQQMLNSGWQLKDIINLVLMIALIAVVIGAVYAINADKAFITTANNQSPLNKTLVYDGKIITYLINSSITQAKVCNASVAYFKTYGGGASSVPTIQG